MARLRCFVIVDGAACGVGLDHRADQKNALLDTCRAGQGARILEEKKLCGDADSTVHEPQTQNPDSRLACNIENIQSKLILSRVLIEQLRNGLACAEYLGRKRELILRELRELVENSHSVLKTTHDVLNLLPAWPRVLADERAEVGWRV